jgi:hypothetical protein
MGNFQLDEDAMRPIIAKAILDEMGADQRDLLVQNALDNLLKPAVVKGQYGRPDERGPSMLEEIIRDKVRALTGQIVDELLAAPEHGNQIRQQVRDGIIVALQSNDNDWLLSSIGYAAGEAVTKVLRESR